MNEYADAPGTRADDDGMNRMTSHFSRACKTKIPRIEGERYLKSKHLHGMAWIIGRRRGNNKHKMLTSKSQLKSWENELRQSGQKLA